jgi:hypothetical protein
MTIRLLRVQSGEDIIADVNEMVIGEEDNQKPIGYLLKRPCVVIIRNAKDFGKVDGAERKASLEVSLVPWISLAKEDIIPVSFDWVVTMVTPTDKLKEIYIEDVLKDGNDNKDSVSDEQSDSDNTD